MTGGHPISRSRRDDASVADATADGGHPVLLRAVEWAAAWLGRNSSGLYAAIIGCFLLAFLLAAWFLSVEADEAWILLSTLRVVGVPLPPTGALANPTVTSGGLHLVLHGLVGLGRGDVFVHRMVSIGAACALLLVVHRTIRGFGRDRSEALVGTALFCAAPGFILQAGLATAEVIATLLLLSGCLHWVRRGRLSQSGAIASGLLFGLACATRVNCVVVLPVIVGLEAISGPGRLRRSGRALAAAAVATAVLGAAMAAYVLAASGSSTNGVQEYFSLSTGVGQQRKSIRNVLRYVLVANQILPVAIVAGVVGAAAATLGGGFRDDARRLCLTLIAVGLTGWAAWVWKAPIPHLRYLWPSIPFIWLAGVILFTTFVARLANGPARVGAHLAVVGTCGLQLLSAASAITAAESLSLVYQANGLSPLVVLEPRLRAANDQRAVSAWMAARPATARFYAVIPQAAYPMTLLSRRTVAPLDEMPSNGPRYLVMVPADRTIWTPPHELMGWLGRNARPVLRRGGFAVWRIDEGARAPGYAPAQVE